MVKLLLFAIKAYQTLSRPFNIHVCRFYPSCSAYAAEAIEKRGAIKGFCLGIWRVLRCSPLSKGGYDPLHPLKHGAIK